MATGNYFRECFDGQARKAMPEPMFRETFCQQCRNPDCVLAQAGQTKWQTRISTQVDRLLDNPDIADPRDPRFEHIRAIDFPSMFRQAMALEISAQRGDWEVPSQSDALQLATTGRVLPPTNKPPKTEEALRDDDPQEFLWEGNVKGDSGKTYRVTCKAVTNEDPTWQCDCPSFVNARDPSGDGLCKHIHWVQESTGKDPQAPEGAETQTPTGPRIPNHPPRNTESSESIPDVPAPGTGIPAPRNPYAAPGPQQSPFIPRLRNTPAPSEGLMIGGAAPPASTPDIDPWAVATPADDVIPVGGKIRLGLTGKKEP